MIDKVQNLVSSLDSCARRVVPTWGKNHYRRKCGQHLFGTSLRLNLAYLAALFACLTLCLLSMPAPASATTWNVQHPPCNATGNGTTDDTAAINTCIGNLAVGDTLLFPCGTYLTTSQLSTITMNNVIVDGSSCATIHSNASGGNILVIGNGAFTGSYGAAVPLSSIAYELSTSFTTASSLGVNQGDYVYINQGGEDYSTDTCAVVDQNPPCQGHSQICASGVCAPACDTSGCRGEVVKVASVSGNTVTVTTALHDTYDPVNNLAQAQKILNPLTGATVKNITLDGSGKENYGLLMLGVFESAVTGVTAKNVVYTALYGNSDFNLAWNNVAVTGAGNKNGAAMGLFIQGNPSVNGASISSLNPGSASDAFGFEFSGSAGGVLRNITVDSTGAYGRPFKTVAARWNTFNSPTVRNGSLNDYNGISIEYYSSHNTYNNCVSANNGTASTGTGNAGINLFGNFNQYNTFNTCTVSGNGNIQFYISGYDALRLAQDSYNTVNGGTFTGFTSSDPTVLGIQGAGAYVHDATIDGPGAFGIYLDKQATYACVKNNTFNSGLGGTINATAYRDLGSDNDPNNGNLTRATCPQIAVFAVDATP